MDSEIPMFCRIKKKIRSSVQSIEPALEIASADQKPLIITAQDVDGESLSTMVLIRESIGLQSKLHGLVTIERTSLNRDISTGKAFGEEGLNLNLQNAQIITQKKLERPPLLKMTCF